MSPINKFEAGGIFLSIAIMAIALGVLRFQTDPTNEDVLAQVNPASQGAVVVAGEDTAGDNSGIAEALIDSSTSDGQLQNLVIDDVTIGSGRKVEEGDTVTAHYIGTTPDGKQFDNSYMRGQPFTFTVGDGKVIEGWEKGVIGMQAGGQRILVIPSDMAYGDAQVGPIEAGSTLVFVIELISIQ